METRHIRLTNEDSLIAKKALLSSEINLIYLIKKLSKYKLLRKKEFILKNKLKTSLTSTKSKLNILLSTFPEEQGGIRKIKRKIQNKENQENQEIAEELEDIQEKLARLS